MSNARLTTVRADALVEAVAEDQPAGVQVVDADLAQALLEVRIEVVDLHALQLAVQQLAQRHAAGAALGQRDHDLVDPALAARSRSASGRPAGSARPARPAASRSGRGSSRRSRRWGRRC